jgi:Ca2+/Na+ antiporter
MTSIETAATFAATMCSIMLIASIYGVYMCIKSDNEKVIGSLIGSIIANILIIAAALAALNIQV